MSDIAYCINSECPFKDCVRHLTHIANKSGVYSMADFSGVCRRYITYLVDENISLGGVKNE